MPQIEIDTGTINTRRASVSVNVWLVPFAAMGTPEQVLFAAAGIQGGRNQELVRKMAGFSHSRSSMRNQDGEPVDGKQAGMMIANRFDVTNGTILKIFRRGSKSWESAQNRGSKTVSTTLCTARYYRVREGAGMKTVRVQMLPSDPRCVVPFSTITGPLELLTVEEAERSGIARVADPLRPLFDNVASAAFFSEIAITPMASEQRTFAPIIPEAPSVTAVIPVRRRGF